MQSIIQKKSYGSVKVFFLDRMELMERIRETILLMGLNDAVATATLRRLLHSSCIFNIDGSSCRPKVFQMMQKGVDVAD